MLNCDKSKNDIIKRVGLERFNLFIDVVNDCVFIANIMNKKYILI